MVETRPFLLLLFFGPGNEARKENKKRRIRKGQVRGEGEEGKGRRKRGGQGGRGGRRGGSIKTAALDAHT